MNKVDLVKKDDLLPLIADYSSMTNFDSIGPISAKNNDGIDLLLADVKDFLQEGVCVYLRLTQVDVQQKQHNAVKQLSFN